MQTKICTKCKQSKPINKFYTDKTQKSGLYSSCKECVKNYRKTPIAKKLAQIRSQKYQKSEKGKKYHREYRQSEKGKMANKKYRTAPGAKSKKRAYDLMRNYNLTPKQHQQLYTNQKGRCALCSKLVSYNRTETDHCHKTGKVRGLLCTFCNHRMMIIDDNEFIRKARKYLKNNT